MIRKFLLFLALCACAPPEMDASFNQVELAVVDSPEESVDAFVALIDGAERSLHVALPSGEDVALGEAIVDAFKRGVEVQVITDITRAEEPAILRMLEAEVPVQLASDGIEYFDFNINADVAWSPEQTLMAHAYAVADRERIVAANRVGFLETGTRVVLELRGERLVEDLLAEHNQVFGGMDATAKTSFSGMAKSIADFRWRYPTPTGVDLELWFGPQERLVKRVIDAVYSARGSAWILTDELTDEGLANALQDKARWGFDMRFVVGPSFGTTEQAITRAIQQSTPDVVKRRVQDVDKVPTIVFIDMVPGLDGERYPAKVFVLNHDLYSAFRLRRGRETINDQLIDGALWGLTDYNEPSAELRLLEEVFWDHFERGAAL